MSDEKYGGSAFPVVVGARRVTEDASEFVCAPGMSLRDWFAGQALAGMLGGSNMEAPLAMRPGETAEIAIARQRSTEARWCYQMADAMLAARSAKR